MELISRADAIKDAESWVAVDEHERHLQKNVIEWLKEFPPAELSTNLAEVSTDAISRQAVIDALGEKPLAWTEGEYELGLQNQWQSDVDALNDLPPVQPEPKRGKWIHDGSKWTNRWICSECGYKWFFDCIEGAFCPNCGAKMTEGDAE